MITRYINIRTNGNDEIIDITTHVDKIASEEKLKDAILFLQVIGSTAAITTMEYEPALVKDVKQLFTKLIPSDEKFAHNLTLNDANGHSHLRSSLLKTNFFVSITDGQLDLGTWQQIVLIDFDTRKRERKIVIKIIK